MFNTTNGSLNSSSTHYMIVAWIPPTGMATRLCWLCVYTQWQCGASISTEVLATNLKKRIIGCSLR